MNKRFFSPLKLSLLGLVALIVVGFSSCYPGYYSYDDYGYYGGYYGYPGYYSYPGYYGYYDYYYPRVYNNRRYYNRRYDARRAARVPANNRNGAYNNDNRRTNVLPSPRQNNAPIPRSVTPQRGNIGVPRTVAPQRSNIAAPRSMAPSRSPGSMGGRNTSPRR